MINFMIMIPTNLPIRYACPTGDIVDESLYLLEKPEIEIVFVIFFLKRY